MSLPSVHDGVSCRICDGAKEMNHFESSEHEEALCALFTLERAKVMNQLIESQKPQRRSLGTGEKTIWEVVKDLTKGGEVRIDMRTSLKVIRPPGKYQLEHSDLPHHAWESNAALPGFKTAEEPTLSAHVLLTINSDACSLQCKFKFHTAHRRVLSSNETEIAHFDAGSHKVIWSIPLPAGSVTRDVVVLEMITSVNGSRSSDYYVFYRSVTHPVIRDALSIPGQTTDESRYKPREERKKTNKPVFDHPGLAPDYHEDIVRRCLQFKKNPTPVRRRQNRVEYLSRPVDAAHDGCGYLKCACEDMELASKSGWTTERPLTQTNFMNCVMRDAFVSQSANQAHKPFDDYPLRNAAYTSLGDGKGNLTFPQVEFFEVLDPKSAKKLRDTGKIVAFESAKHKSGEYAPFAFSVLSATMNRDKTTLTVELRELSEQWDPEKCWFYVRMATMYPVQGCAIEILRSGYYQFCLPDTPTTADLMRRDVG